MTPALWFSQGEYGFHKNSRTREELRDDFIQVSSKKSSHFFRRPNPVIMGNNLYRITQWGPEVGPMSLWHPFQDFSYHPNCMLVSTSFCLLFFFFFSVWVCLLYLRIQGSYLTSYPTPNIPISVSCICLGKVFCLQVSRESQFSLASLKDARWWARSLILSNTEGSFFHRFIASLASILSLFIFFNLKKFLNLKFN